MFLNRIRQWARRQATSPASQRGRSVRLTLEVLEERRLLSFNYHGGRLLENVNLVPVFYGQAWNDAANKPTMMQFQNFLNFIVKSSYMDMLDEEYSNKINLTRNPPGAEDQPPDPAKPWFQRAIDTVVDASHAVVDTVAQVGNAVGNAAEEAYQSLFGLTDFTPNATSFPSGYQIGRGTSSNPFTVTDSSAPRRGATISDADIQKWLKSQISSGKSTPDKHTLYVVVTPPNSPEQGCDTRPGGICNSDDHNISYHKFFDITRNDDMFNTDHADPMSVGPRKIPNLLPYAVITYPTSNFMRVHFRGYSPLDEMTESMSHELAEAVTNPMTFDHTDQSLKSGWWEDNPGRLSHEVQDDEVGDLCERSDGSSNSYDQGVRLTSPSDRLNFLVQKMYSKKLGGDTARNLGDGQQTFCRAPAGSTEDRFNLVAGPQSLGLVGSAVPTSGNPIDENLDTHFRDGTIFSTQTDMASNGNIVGTFIAKNVPPGTNIQTGDGTIETKEGVVLVRYTVQPPANGIVMGTFTITPEGQADGYLFPAGSYRARPTGDFNDVLGSVVDGNPGLQAAIDWGDGTSSAGVVQADPAVPNKFTISGSHSYGPAAAGKWFKVFTTLKDNANRLSPLRGLMTVLPPKKVPTFFAVGGAPGHVQIRKTKDGSLMTEFAPYGPGYTGGISVAVGDINGDGFPDLVTGATAGNPHVKVYDGKAIANGTFNAGNPEASVLAQWFPYALQFNVGANVAVGDVEGNGFADIVTGATAGNPHVKVFRGRDIAKGTFDDKGASLRAQWFPYALQFNVGANVAVGDLNGDGLADVVTGATVGNPHVKIFSGKAIATRTLSSDNPDASMLAQVFPYALQFNVGAFVAVGDVDGDGFPDLITSSSVGNPQVKVYKGKDIPNGAFNKDTSLLDEFFAFNLGQNIGAAVGAADFETNGKLDIIAAATRGTPAFRVIRHGATGVNPPAVFEGVASGLQNGISVGI